MTICYLGAVREITGVREQTLSAPNVRGLLETLLQTYGNTWKEQVFDGKALTSDVVVMVNGLNIQQIKGLSTPLGATDRIDIFPMFEGG